MEQMILTLIAALLVTSAASIQENSTVTPVILIPGICGSQIDGWYVKDSAPHYYCQKDSGGWTLLWLCIDCMIPPHHFVVQFEKLIVGLEKLPGYQRGISIRGAPYDFRYTPNTKVGQQYMIKLRYLIEETYELNGNTRVVLVAHSMGNPVTVRFLKSVTEEWKEKYIEGYVALAGVFGGAAKAIRSLLSGETEGMPQIIVDPLTMREFERTSPSVYWLLPNPQLFGDTPFVFSHDRNYSAHDYKALFEDVDIPQGPEMYDFIKDLPQFDREIGVDVYCIHGKDQETPFQFQYGDNSKFPDNQPTTLSGDGDGTVNIQSLELCKEFTTLRDYKTVTGFLATHLEILQRKDVIQYIADLLTKKNLKKNNDIGRKGDLVF
ncbi:hypothetical protein ACHWQZ_G008986 [Mnemiopsis leidyi]